MNQSAWTDNLESDNYFWGFQHTIVAKRAISVNMTTAFTLGLNAGEEVIIQNFLYISISVQQYLCRG